MVFRMDKCKHGFDHACLICGFTHIDGKKVWFDWAWQEQQKRIDKLQKSANEMDEYITTAQKCLPYYLLDQESDENWIGGVQNEIVKLEQKNDELQTQVDAQKKHIKTALIAVEDIHKSAMNEFHEWDVLKEKIPKLCEHLQNLSVAVGELEEALKGGEK